MIIHVSQLVQAPVSDFSKDLIKWKSKFIQRGFDPTSISEWRQKCFVFGLAQGDAWVDEFFFLNGGRCKSRFLLSEFFDAMVDGVNKCCNQHTCYGYLQGLDNHNAPETKAD